MTVWNRPSWIIISCSLLLFIFPACTSLQPLHEPGPSLDELKGALERLSPEKAGVSTFISKGLLEVKDSSGSEILSLVSVGRFSPFALRVEVASRQGAPIVTIIIKERAWRAINWMEKNFIEGQGGCPGKGLLGICMGRMDIFSIVYGRFLLDTFEVSEIHVPEKKVTIRDGEGNLKRIFLGGMPIQPTEVMDIQSGLTISFKDRRQDSREIKGDPIKITAGILSPVILFRQTSIRERIEFDEHLLEVDVPKGFKVIGQDRNYDTQ